MKKKHKLFLTLLLFSLTLIFFVFDNEDKITSKENLADITKKQKIDLKEKSYSLKETMDVNNGLQLKEKIQNHLNLSHALGEDAERNYQASLNELKKDRDINTSFLIQEYEYTIETNYEKRQIIVETIRELKSSLSVTFFKPD